ncbi:unnamed protein product [marine sediment metagenome]|uniref:Uncharacterized protein n=1 Tax=marine sediment metagenome TaxID=412755 RepID=X1FCC1_9ZZZZ
MLHLLILLYVLIQAKRQSKYQLTLNLLTIYNTARYRSKDTIKFYEIKYQL